MADAGQGWWSRRTQLERCLVAVTTIFSIAFVVLVTVLAWCLLRGDATTDGTSTSRPRRGSHPLNRVCLTPGCVSTASQVLALMDKNAEPCDDFYLFACGRFMNETDVPDDKVVVGVSQEIGNLLTEQLRVLLEEPINANEARPFRLIKQLYRACINTSRLEARGLAPLKAVLDDLGGWPVLRGEDWDVDAFDWKATVYLFRKLGLNVNCLIGTNVMKDLKNNSRMILSYSGPELGLHREYLIKGPDNVMVEVYHQTQINVAVVLGADQKHARKEMKEVLRFEMALAAITLPAVEMHNFSNIYNLMTLSEMQKKYPSIPWVEYTTHLLPEDVHVSGDEIVIVIDPNFITKFELLLSVSPKRAVANYLLWRATMSIVPYTTREMRNIMNNFTSYHMGQQKQPPRRTECTILVTDRKYLPTAMSRIAGAMYVRRFFDKESKHLTLELVNEVKQSFEKTLRETNWMDETTRRKALAKLKSMTAYVGYPDELLEDSILTDLYTKLHIDERRFLESFMNITRFDNSLTLSQFRLPVKKSDWIQHSNVAVVNAFYHSTENAFYFPAGILQGRLFGRDRPEYMNYGAIGFIVGHEITHGFDNLGKQFDDKGNLVDWWNTETEGQFLKRAKCLSEQYSNFTEPLTGLRLNGILSLRENIADNGGIKQAYLAYKQWTDRRGVPEPRLPGLEWLGPRQMFWVASAQFWCTKYRDEYMRTQIIEDFHSPAEFRVKGPLSNHPDFASDFGCPAGSPMNPKHKCQVW